jgi:hypothetical protein
MPLNTITSTAPITVSQGHESVIYDKIMIAGVTATQKIDGEIVAQVAFRYCRLDAKGEPIMAPAQAKILTVKNLLADPSMADACEMFFEKLVAAAMAAGVLP